MRSKLANNTAFAKQKYHADGVSISLKIFTTHSFYVIIHINEKKIEILDFEKDKKLLKDYYRYLDSRQKK